MGSFDSPVVFLISSHQAITAATHNICKPKLKTYSQYTSRNMPEADRYRPDCSSIEPIATPVVEYYGVFTR